MHMCHGVDYAWLRQVLSTRDQCAEAMLATERICDVLEHWGTLGSNHHFTPAQATAVFQLERALYCLFNVSGFPTEVVNIFYPSPYTSPIGMVSAYPCIRLVGLVGGVRLLLGHGWYH